MDNIESGLVTECLASFGKDLLNEITASAKTQWFEPDEFIIKQGQLARHLPIVISGTAKVYITETDVQLLLYYIYPGATCIFSFAHLFGDQVINFSATAQEKSLLLLIPIQQAREWLLKYRAFNNMILAEYQKHYNDLLETTKQLVCHNLEERLLIYLKTQTGIAKSNILSLSHQSIANDFATSREVISRVLKKMEKDQKIIQVGRKIKVLG